MYSVSMTSVLAVSCVQDTEFSICRKLFYTASIHGFMERPLLSLCTPFPTIMVLISHKIKIHIVCYNCL